MAALNARRSKIGVPNISYDLTMAKLAGVRAKETYTLFSHTRPNGSDCNTVYAEYGVKKPTYNGECLCYATSFDDVDDIIDTWMSSSAHKSIIMSSKYNKFGMATYQGPDGKTYAAILVGKV